MIRKRYSLPLMSMLFLGMVGGSSLAADNVVVIPLISGTRASGDAIAADVMEGKTFSSTAGIGITGTMVNNGAVTITPGASDQPVTQGYHNGSGSVVGDADLSSANIRNGVNLFGVGGTVLVPTGTATAAQVLSGTTFSNGSATGISWTMTDVGAQSVTPGTSAQTITQGYHNGSGTVDGDAELVSGNIKNGVDIFGVVGTVLVPTGNAAASQVLTGSTFSNASATGITGSMANVGTQNATPGTTAQTITQGYHDGSGTVAGDAALVSANIKSGINLFGVDGDPNVVDTTSGDAVEGDITAGKIAWVDGLEVTGTGTALAYPASVARTGQTSTVPLAASTGSDGDLQKGVAWPSPRFSDNTDGTVTDNLTGLIWLQDMNCLDNMDWASAISFANTLASGFCGLTDGSVAGDWRLPNVKELQSVVAYQYANPALSNDAGDGQWADDATSAFFYTYAPAEFWSSTTYANSTAYALYVSVFWYGKIDFVGVKASSLYTAWPVRN